VTAAACDGNAASVSVEPLPSETILAWLAGNPDDQAADVSEEQLPPRTRLRTNRGKTQHRFEAFDTGNALTVPVHAALLAE